MNESLCVIIIIVIFLYSSLQLFFQPIDNNTNAFAISKVFEHDDSFIIQTNSSTTTITITTTKEKETTSKLQQQSPCPEGFFINQTSNKCDERQQTAEEEEEEYSNKAISLVNLKNYAKAIEYYDKALELDPSFALAYYNKDLTSRENLDRFKEDISTYIQALSINPLYKDISEKLQNINDSIQFSKTKSYNITELGLEFQYPLNWKIEKINEGHLFNSTKFFIPTTHGNGQLVIRPLYTSSMTDLSSMISNIEREDIYYGNWTVINSFQMNLKSKEGYFLEMFNQRTDERYVTFNFIHNKVAISVQLSIPNRLFPEYKQIFYDFLNTIKFHEREIGLNPTFNIGERPTGFEIDINRNVAYVPHLNSRSLSVFDIKQNKIIENISVGIKPNDVAFESFDNLIFVADIGSDTVSVIESATRKVITDIPVGKLPAKLAVDSDEMERLIFVSNTNSSSVTPISGQSLQTFPEIKVGQNPVYIDVNPFTNKLYVSNTNSSYISIIDYINLGRIVNTKSNTIDLDTINCHNGQTSGIAVDTFANKVYVACTYLDPAANNRLSSKIIVIDGITNQFIAEIPISLNPEEIRVNPYNHKIIVTHANSNQVTIIDGGKSNKINDTISLTDYSRINFLDIDPKNNIAYISRTWSDNVVPLNISSGKLLGGINFNITSSNTTKIECSTNQNKSSSAINQYTNGDFFMTEIGTLVSCRNPADTNQEDFIGWSSPFFILENSNSTHGIFNVTSVGHISPVFKEIPPRHIVEFIEFVKSKYYDFIFAVPTSLILGPTFGWLIYRYLDKLEKRRELRNLRVLIDLIDDGYKERSNNKEECIKFLREKHNEIIKLLKGGVIKESTYHLLNERINEHFQSLRSV